MDRDTFWSIINPLQERLFRFAVSILKNKEDAQDAVHDVFEKLWYKRNNFNREKGVDAFVFKVMKNHCIDLLRKQKKLLEVDLISESIHVESEYENKDLIELIKHRFSQLPIQQRMVIELKDFQGYDYDEISKIMDVPISTLRVILSRARKNVLKSIKNEIRGV